MGMSLLCEAGHRKHESTLGSRCRYPVGEAGRRKECGERVIEEPQVFRCGCGRGIFVGGHCCFCGRTWETQAALEARHTEEATLTPSDLPKRGVRMRPGERIAIARARVAQGRAMKRR